MKILWNRTPCGERVIALGTFDGLHRGHRVLIHTAARLARTLDVPLQVCTFDRHPLRVIRPEIAPKELTLLPEKLALLARLGVAETRVLAFTQAVADQEPEDFLCSLRRMMHLRHVVVGWNYSFGKGGRGTPDLLRLDGRRHGYRVTVIPPVQMEDGQIVSSTAIRGCLADGDLARVRELLCSPYQITGRCLGSCERAPSRAGSALWMNVSAGKQLPAEGVYACETACGGVMAHGLVCVGSQEDPPSVKLLTRHTLSVKAGDTVRLWLPEAADQMHS